jgi:hypothetical protein
MYTLLPIFRKLLLVISAAVILTSCDTTQGTVGSPGNNVPSTYNVSLIVETDFHYYYVMYNGGSSHSGKENPNGKTRWEKTFTAAKGQSLSLTTETVTSNMSGSRIAAKILVNGKVVSQDERTTDCPPGAPCGKPLKIDLSAIAN